MMVIGLKSGREFVVRDASFFIQTQDGTLKQVFISEDGKRRIIAAESEIEFYDEPNTQEYLDKIHESVKETTAKLAVKKEGEMYG